MFRAKFALRPSSVVDVCKLLNDPTKTHVSLFVLTLFGFYFFSWPFLTLFFTMIFRIVQWNIHSFPHNKPYILSALSSLAPDVLCPQETWTTLPSSLSLPGFQLASHYDRPGNPVGGVAVLCANSTPNSPLTLSTPLEATAVRLHLSSKTLTVVFLYLLPQLALDSLISDLSSLVSSLPSPFLICTDANTHHTSWGSPSSDCRGNILVNWIAENNLALSTLSATVRHLADELLLSLSYSVNYIS